jgi:hypothetical protein
LEGGNDLEQHVGSHVQVTGRIETDDDDAVTVAQRPDDELELNDLPEFHVDTLQAMDQTCGGTYEGKQAQPQSNEGKQSQPQSKSGY